MCAATNESSTNARPAAAILTGGLIAGVLDITYAILRTIQLGGDPVRMLKSIAGGLLGKEVMQAGTAYAVLGFALHFVIALGAATAYFLISRKFALLRERAALSGILYGALFYLFMNRLVLPLSALASKPVLQMLGLLVHMFLIGLPIALSVRKYAGSR